MAAPNDNVFIADLPMDMDEAKIQGIFGAYGNITSIKLCPGGNRMAALVRFGSLEEATWIVENLNGNIAQGLQDPITVRYASSGNKGKGGLGGGGAGERWTPYFNKGDYGGKDSDKGKGKGKGKGSITVLKKGLQHAGVLPGGRWTNDENALFIGGLPTDTTDYDLYEIFATFGPIPSQGVRAMMNPDGSCKGIGFVNFLDASSALAAINTLNGTMMPDGTTLKVSQKQVKKD
mmetsp:Transcript_24352/g.36962  ORF Transcript_24352/g.36962 Transcript_24352/m.36962 type:complete len:233 (+) Transcript_24352:132-830(+)|eukprot:CAMPEP_0194777166 /NCGR_PEP_ID=MMETSP0323_2-20130528/64950_1 /TAXON_ID=2866 ORGANISM="Crypthecodinium cohnii, Strain Seligo" /NCGR_SAMPLE_ID=MMETSP0323_2 /ASSEMBLY_ACC=CAM_ASM_000346 /LENGTH=232 /DNA_ID=CAMNT_0039713867 /DNA_START=55 /DNA_END=753 /DNA_ORIENTATION=-